jgi:ATPase subunit of ABC transporter with duplicated ATPase domains
MFAVDLNIVDWLTQYVEYTEEKDTSWVRSFLGRMLFAGEDALKMVKVLSGGEKVRCMIARLMVEGANTMVLDQPTNHLDLESITSLNNGLIDYKGNLLFISHDHQFIQTVANRIIEITPKGVIDRRIPYDEYLKDEKVKAMRAELY